jgi:hypothetical protein
MKKYKCTVRQVLVEYFKDDCSYSPALVVARLTETVEEKWKPDVGERCYSPDIYNPEDPSCYTWENDSEDRLALKHNLVFKTKEEAIARAKELLGIKEEE